MTSLRLRHVAVPLVASLSSMESRLGGLYSSVPRSFCVYSKFRPFLTRAVLCCVMGARLALVVIVMLMLGGRVYVCCGISADKATAVAALFFCRSQTVR